MIVNFKIEDHSALSFQGRLIDLHNNFDFSSCMYDVFNRELKLIFKRSEGDWIKSDELSEVSLTHTNVFRFNTNYDNKAREFPNDDLCLNDLTFFPSSEKHLDNSIVLQAKPDENDDIIYMFQSDYFIRVGCEKIELLVTK